MELLRFYAETYIHLDQSLTWLETELNGDEVSAPDHEGGLTGDRLNLSPERKAQANSALSKCRQQCEEIKLQVCVKHVDELLSLVKTGRLGANDVGALRDNVMRELSCHFFVGVPSERRELFQNGRKGWEDIAGAFPISIDDIEEMNRCFALCRYEAAVFHSLMVLEHGLVKLGDVLNAADPKQGWNATFNELDRVKKAGRAANTTGLNFDQLDQLYACLEVMKLAWRNKVNHATGKPIVMHGGFAPDVTEEILFATRGFLRRLMTVLSL